MSGGNYNRRHLALALTTGLIAAPVLSYVWKRWKKYVRQLLKNEQLTLLDDEIYDTQDFVQEDDDSSKSWTSLGFEEPLVIAMVGLPARGKSYISKMLMRYLNWTGFESKLFNVGSHRRKIGLASADANFFSATNTDAKRIREEMAMAVQETMYAWIKDVNSTKRRVAIFDATNTTIRRRKALAIKARSEHVYLLFIESICDDPKVLSQNYALKLQNDDYRDKVPEDALEDFMGRVKEYEKVYEPIQDDEDNERISYVKMINVGQKVITRNCTGYLPSQVALYLQNLHIQPRKIYLSLNAEFDDSQARPGVRKMGLFRGNCSPASSSDALVSLLGQNSALRSRDSTNSLKSLNNAYSSNHSAHGQLESNNGGSDKGSGSPSSGRSTHAGMFGEIRRRLGGNGGHLPSTDVLAAFDNELSESDLQEKRKLTEAGRQYTLNIAKYLSSLYQEDARINTNSIPTLTRKPSGVENADGELDDEEEDNILPGSQLMVITGTSDVHTHTVMHLRTMFKCYNSPLLNELRGGDFQGYRMDDIQLLHPEEFRKRQKDKLNYRYPGPAGESYRDVIERLRPIIVELERQRHSVLVVCHMAVLRCIYSYFMDIPLEELPYLLFDKHVFYELSPGPFGCQMTKRRPNEEVETIVKQI